MRKVRVFIVESLGAVRKSIRAIVESSGNIELVGEAGVSAGLFVALKDKKPEIVLINVVLPDIDGINAISEITRRLPGVQVIAYSLGYDMRLAQESLEAGAAVYLYNRADLDRIMLAVAEGGLAAGLEGAVSCLHGMEKNRNSNARREPAS